MSEPKPSRLQASQYFSPYVRAGAPGVNASDSTIKDPYTPLRAKALATLEQMGFEPQTMVERGVAWAEDQDPFGHVMQSQYMHYFGLVWQRVMESYDEYFSPDEYRDLIQGKSILPVIHKYEMQIKRQIKHPDSLIIAWREEEITPSTNFGRTVIFSLQQQAVVAECVGNSTYIDAKTGRPTDIRNASKGWRTLYEAFSNKAEHNMELLRKWEAEHPRKKKSRI